MASAKQDSATYNMTCLLREWDRAPKEKRRQFLQDFIDQHWNRSGPELESELAQMASLFLARICVWIKLTYMSGTCLTEQLQALYIFLSASSSHNYLLEFLEHGGVLCLQELCISPNGKEIDKCWALKVLSCVANSGTKYKETICECYGIRAVAECMAKSKSEETQEAARDLLEILAEGNPRFNDQVYKGLIGVLPCHSPKAQQLALQTLRILQTNRDSANRALIDRVIYLLESLHLEVQSAVIELVRVLMKFEIADDILMALITLLKPQREIQLGKLFTEAASESDLSDALSPSDSEYEEDDDTNKNDDDDENDEISMKDKKDPEEDVNKSDELDHADKFRQDSGVQGSSRHSAGGVAFSSVTNNIKNKNSLLQHKFKDTVRSSKSGTDNKINERKGIIHTDRKVETHPKHNTSVNGNKIKKKIKYKKKLKKKHSDSDSDLQPLPVFVQQASAAKCIRILSQDSPIIAKKLLKMGALSSLLYAMGNMEFPDSQRQASSALEYLCQTYPLVDQVVREAMGPSLHDEFTSNPDSHYLQMTPLQADVLVSNKVTFLGEGIEPE